MSGARPSRSWLLWDSRFSPPSVVSVPAGVSGGECMSGLRRLAWRRGEPWVAELRVGCRLGSRDSSSRDTV